MVPLATVMRTLMGYQAGIQDAIAYATRNGATDTVRRLRNFIQELNNDVDSFVNQATYSKREEK